jgi:hypothetical protein
LEYDPGSSPSKIVASTDIRSPLEIAGAPEATSATDDDEAGVTPISSPGPVAFDEFSDTE